MSVRMLKKALTVPRVAITVTSATRITLSPTAATATYQLANNGDINVNGSDVGDWINPKAAAGAAYECQATVLSGSFTSGTFGSWLALSSSRSWALTNSSAGTTATASMTLEIRRTLDNLVVASVTVSFSAEVSL